MEAWRGSSGSLAPALDAIPVLAAQARLHARDALIRNPLHETHVEATLVPLDDSPLDLEEGQADRRLPILGRTQDQVVEGVTDLCAHTRGTR